MLLYGKNTSIFQMTIYIWFLYYLPTVSIQNYMYYQQAYGEKRAARFSFIMHMRENGLRQSMA